jgi:mannose-6-phosphate isomerase-like protein (cupin superfamily)
VDEPIIIFNADAPVEIHGGEGGSGPLFWKRLVGGVDLHGDWEGFEYARVAAGGVIGEHVHSRTEEFYYVTSGHAVMHLDDVAYNVGPGDLILTPIDGKHRAKAAADEDFEFIVAEVLPPQILDPSLKETRTFERRPSVIVNLVKEKAIDPTRYFDGPWQSLELRQLKAKERTELSGQGSEHAFYVLSGSGTAKSGKRTIELSTGHGLAIPKGGHATIDAGPEGLNMFLMTVRLNGVGTH